MYSERDIIDINSKIKKNFQMLVPMLILLIAAYVAALLMAAQWLVYAVGALICVVACYGVIACLAPNMRYRRFLLDMQEGLSREMKGRIVEISHKSDYQDGVRVLPVRIFLESEQDERIVYLNASKTEDFPAEGETVVLRCYGRHIREAAMNDA